MNAGVIVCPHCKEEISVDEVIRHDAERRLRKELETEIEMRIEKEKIEAAREAVEKANKDSNRQLKSLRDEVNLLQEKNTKLIVEEEQLLKKQRALEDRERELNLEVEKRLLEDRQKTWNEVSTKKDEEFRMRLAEEDKTKADLLKQIEELRRKAEQGSQQLQGEVLELELEKFLISEFPADLIKPVGKGIRGADVLQEVRDHLGQIAGVIIWESKRTKEFKAEWVTTLKSNSIDARADVAILVTQVLPVGMGYFGPREGVYISSFECVKEVARLIRGTLIKVYQAKVAGEGKDGSKEQLWQYVTSSDFAQKASMVIETFQTEKDELEREKRAYQAIWARREQRLTRVINNMTSLYGDFQGLVGNQLENINVLELDSGEVADK